MKTACRVAFARIDRSNPYAGTCQRVFDSQERRRSLIFDKFYLFRSTAKSRISVRNPAGQVQRPRLSVLCSLTRHWNFDATNGDSSTFTGPMNESSRNWLSRQIPRHCTVSSRVFEPITAENFGTYVRISSRGRITTEYRDTGNAGQSNTSDTYLNTGHWTRDRWRASGTRTRDFHPRGSLGSSRRWWRGKLSAGSAPWHRDDRRPEPFSSSWTWRAGYALVSLVYLGLLALTGHALRNNRQTQRIIERERKEDRRRKRKKAWVVLEAAVV